MATANHDTDTNSVFVCSICHKKIINKSSCLREESVYDQNSSKKFDVSLLLLECPHCRKDVAVIHEGETIVIDDFLFQQSSGTGIKQVKSGLERKIIHILSQVCHNEYDLEVDLTETTGESPFLPHPPDEQVWIMWLDGQAAGFYSIKEKGCMLTDSVFEVYEMNIVDTIYVRKQFRGHGLGTRMVRDALQRYPDNRLGFSSPVSDSLKTVLLKMLIGNSSLRGMLWECAYDGSESYSSNIWLELKRSTKQRQD